MSNTSKPIVIHPLTDLAVFQSLVCPGNVRKTPPQLTYIFEYLRDLGVKTIIEEQNYFDRDYLAEFANFYSLAAKGYPNICRRLHFFTENIDRAQLEAACGNSAAETTLVTDLFVGFSVIRPIPSAPFGRTVLAWYTDTTPTTPRQIQPCRAYTVHLAGVALTLKQGLAWQQQDAGVSACATIGLWTMLHSASFNDRHAVPTTPDVTQAAHRNVAVGSRVFPSVGLRFEQICEAVKVLGLSPFIIEGDVSARGKGTLGFSEDKFCSSMAALIRSGYPCLLMGEVKRPDGGGLHVSVVVGFRSTTPKAPAAGKFSFADANIKYLYIHDDNIGPSVKFEVSVKSKRVELTPGRPTAGSGQSLSYYGKFIPFRILVAVDSDLRTSADQLNRAGIRATLQMLHAMTAAATASNPKAAVPGLLLETRFIKYANFMTEEMSAYFSSKAAVLSKVRLQLAEAVPPMSLHLGIIRIGDTTGRYLDILHDTTDSDVNHPVFATICYDANIHKMVNAMVVSVPDRFGIVIAGY